MRTFAALYLAAVALLAPSPSAAEPSASARRGLMVGASMGLGIVHAGGYDLSDEPSPSLAVRVGHGVSASTVVYGHFGMSAVFPTTADGPDRIEATTARVGVQSWVAGRVWFNAGAGIGRLARIVEEKQCLRGPFECNGDVPKSVDAATGVSAAVGVGVNLYQRASFGVDAHLGVQAVAAEPATWVSTGATVGVHWY